ncbi:enoyl-CoA hydratase/isomerase family protein [Novosphingobium sp. 9U]|uniref:enoyl-CoA hydratase/isomerase family protein n=1 Tax=Novosphingobium sp. 9U TaxID=2653158 RepID=UPI0012F30EED|nr:enoyl-CoA hydratase/isomerase family protein [Novosphingobium sp. 9U]VWX54094.1 Enoyl-CoA hydratase/carnithine racemase [Novosphingobium sp. 9U]
MDLASLTITPARLSRLEEPWTQPLALVLLTGESYATDLYLPACPVIGLGAANHPLGTQVDVLLEPGANPAPLAAAILAQPHAAATLVEVLRVTETMPPLDALSVESMAYAMLQGSAAHGQWKGARETNVGSVEGRVALSRMGEALVITLDRPQASNAIDRSMRDGLFEAFALAAADPDVTRVVLQAHGKAFSLGADLQEFGTTNDPAAAHAIRMATLPARSAIDCANRLEVRIDGACVGAGLELAAFGHRITATARAWFQLPELAMGIIPGAGGCVSIPRRIGRQRAALMMLSGRRLGARQALAWGLIDAIVDQFPGDDGGDDVG